MSVADHFKELRCAVKRIDHYLDEGCKCEKVHLCRVLDIENDDLLNDLKKAIQKIENDVNCVNFLSFDLDQLAILSWTLQVMAKFNKNANCALKETHKKEKIHLVENLITAALAVEAKVEIWQNRNAVDAFINISAQASQYNASQIRELQDSKIFRISVRQ